MAPLIDESAWPIANQKYELTILPLGMRIEVDPSVPAPRRIGLPGCLLQILIRHPEIQINHECGGVGSCGTCRVEVIEGGEICNPPAPLEIKTLAETFPAAPRSARLSCQCVPNGQGAITITIK